MLCLVQGLASCQARSGVVEVGWRCKRLDPTLKVRNSYFGMVKMIDVCINYSWYGVRRVECMGTYLSVASKGWIGRGENADRDLFVDCLLIECRGRAK